MSESRTKGRTRVSPARAAVLPHLEAKARRFPELYPDPLDTSGLDPRDAGLAEAIDREVTVRWTTLRAIIEPLLSQPWNRQHHAVLAAIMGGAAQLLFLDRVPDHAAIDESVGWCNTTGARRAAGVVNAVLRKIVTLRGERLDHADVKQTDHLLRADGSGWKLSAPVFNGQWPDRLAEQTGCGKHFLARARASDGEDEAARLAVHAMSHPPVIMHGMSGHEHTAAHIEPGFHVLTGSGRLSEVLQACPDAIVQDPTAAAACRATGAIVPDLIVDWCAGRGTKTRQLAAMHPNATIIATDASEARRRDLQAVASAAHNVHVQDPSTLTTHAGQVDLLVLDVPCSNSGVLARRPEARHRQDDATRARLISLQRQIAADALALLAPRGTLLWATCSIDPEENERQIEWLTTWHPLAVQTMHREPGYGGPNDPPTAWRDGGFFAMLRSTQPVHPGETS